MPDVNSAHMSQSCGCCVFSCSKRREGTAETVGMFNKQQKSTRPVQTRPISAQRRGSRKLSDTGISLATGFHQSQGRTTVTGTNLLSLFRSLSASLVSLVSLKKREGNRRKKKKNFCRGMKFTEQTFIWFVSWKVNQLPRVSAELQCCICWSFSTKNWQNKCLQTSQQTLNHMVQLSPEAHNGNFLL